MRLRSLHFQHRVTDVEVELPTSGWGAFLVRAGDKVCSVFASGVLSERSLRIWQAAGGQELVLLDNQCLQGHSELIRGQDDWVCRNRMSGVQLVLEDRTGNLVLRDDRGESRTTLDAICAFLGIASRTIPVSDTAVDPTPVLPMATEPLETLESESMPGPSPAETQDEQTTPFEVHSQAHGHLVFQVPLSLSESECKIIYHLARYGFVSQEDLKRIAGRRSPTITSNLVHRLYEAQYPLIRVTESQSYEFVTPE